MHNRDHKKSDTFFIKPDLSILCIFIMGIIYIVFPSVNNSLDSIGYAVDIRESIRLFSPHHLLYTSFGYALCKIFSVEDILPFMCFINAVFSVFILCIVRSILIRFTDSRSLAIILIFLGSCFGFIRFATDNEAYIIPLFFSLAGSKVLLTYKNIFLGSLLAAIACLFHQIHFFWWLGLFFFVIASFPLNRIKNMLLYLLPALIVPLVYVIVFFFAESDCSNVIEFIFHDYCKTSYVEFKIKPITFLLSFVNLFRTFFQVHGYILPLIQKFPGFILFPVLSIILILTGMIKIRKSIFKQENINDFKRKFALYHFVIFGMQFLFAFISDGNAEFMIMIPFALALFFFIKYKINNFKFIYFALSLFIWNVSLGVIPYHFMTLSSDSSIVNYIVNHPKENNYCLSNVDRVSSLLNYYHRDSIYNLYSYTTISDKSDSITGSNGSIVTDLYDNTLLYSRASILEKSDDEIFKNVTILKTDTLEYDLGKWYLTTLIR